ncbi:MAG: hypothetical protein P1U54_12250 [Immundisolibacteraceae bacterium]|nr:hypothetical protein [Immundisolibacteraceae bacterium]
MASTPDFFAPNNNWVKLRTSLENYFSDHFIYREWMILRYKREVRKRFGQGITDKVIIGKNGWLYLSDDRSIEDFLGKRKVPDEAIDNLIINWEKREKHLAEKGIRFLIVIAPNKQSIYPNNLPSQIQKRSGKTVLQRLRERMVLRDNQPTYWLDLIPGLLAQKAKGPLYYQTDTHWNDRGGYYGYLQIRDTLENWFPNQLPPDHVKFLADSPKKGGDLARMLLAETDYSEIHPKYAPNPMCAKKVINSDYLSTAFLQANQTRGGKGTILTSCADAKIKALVFRDSFGAALLPFLAENFNVSFFTWSRYSSAVAEEAIATYQPDIIIEQYAERFLLLE